jgi:hypothetical protein
VRSFLYCNVCSNPTAHRSLFTAYGLPLTAYCSIAGHAPRRKAAAKSTKTEKLASASSYLFWLIIGLVSATNSKTVSQVSAASLLANRIVTKLDGVFKASIFFIDRIGLAYVAP